MRKWLVLATLALGGCSNLAPYYRTETAYQVLNAMDVAQTIRGPVQHPGCYVETNALLGEHPSAAKVAVWGAAVGALHYGVSLFLDRQDAPKWLRATWQALSLGSKVSTVVQNRQQDVRVFGTMPTC